LVSGKSSRADNQPPTQGNLSNKSDIATQLQNYFTASQTKQILTQKRVVWSEEDIVGNLMLYSLSRKAYQFIRIKKLFPVPSVSTLRKWVQNFKCSPGLLTDVLVILQKQVTSETKENFKLAVLCFDEVEIHKKFEYYQAEDRIFPAHKKAQVAILRGLCHNWKKPVYFEFDAPMTEKTLSNIICNVEAIGIEIWAVTCDVGPSNQALFNCLGINTAVTSFPNPADASREIFAFFDVPHLLKLIRNHVLDTGIDVDGKGSIINSKDFEVIPTHEWLSLHSNM